MVSLTRSISVFGFRPEVLGATLSAETDATVDFALLLVEFTAAHFFFNTAAFDKFAETTNRFLNGFILSQRKFDH